MADPLPLVYYGNPLLRERSIPVEKFDEELDQFIDALIATMAAHPAGGLAAVQVGRPIRVFVKEHYTINELGQPVYHEPEVFINPVLVEPSEEEVHGVEGCLSLPGIQAGVIRPLAITIEAYDRKGNFFRRRYEGWPARQLMHETDHLNGKLMIDRVKGRERERLEPKLQALKRKYRPK